MAGDFSHAVDRAGRTAAPIGGCFAALLFCACLIVCGSLIVWAGWRGVVTRNLVIGSRSGGTLQQTTSSTSTYSGLAAVRVGSGMIGAGLLLVGWGASFAVTIARSWRRSAAGRQPRRSLCWLSLATLVITSALLFPPWGFWAAAFWIGAVATFWALTTTDPDGAGPNHVRTAFMGAIVLALAAPAYGWSSVIALLFAIGVFGHLVIPRFPRRASWSPWPLANGEAQA